MRLIRSRLWRDSHILMVLFLSWCGMSFGQGAKPTQSRKNETGEQRTVRALESVRANPLELYEFLRGMPKGADLHNHIYGAVYAETWILDAAEDSLCIDLATDSFVKAPAMTRDNPPQPECGDGKVPALRAFTDQHLYDTLIDAFSMRGFVPTTGTTAHDHFFDAFGRFAPNLDEPRHLGEWLDELATRAASQNEQYLELMHTPDFQRAAALAHEIGWPSSGDSSVDFSKFRDELLARGLRDKVITAKAEIDHAEALRQKLERCGEKDQAEGCKVIIRYLYQVLRGFPKEQVFAQTLLGFETATADPRFVGINFVMPEDGEIAMADYALQMKMVNFLHGLYPNVHISLHAGELAPSLVPYEGLCCHIRLAVEEGDAERIGHGVDIMYEDHPYELLKEMSAKHVMVEINLTSNDKILGLSGTDEPFSIYRKFGVPVALSTDDEGVSRIDLTHEFVRATQSYGLGYTDLKKLVRTSLEHSFLPGSSFWAEQDVFTKSIAGCAQEKPGNEKPSVTCAAFLKSSEKAQQQWELERRFTIFEAVH
jgi:adenosine deaminase